VSPVKIIYAGALSTSLVILLGVAMIAPIFIPNTRSKDSLNIALHFVVGQDSTPTWCNQLSSYLNKENMRATVFLSGKFALIYPEYIAGFGKGIDIGSQTFSYANLTAIEDYSIQVKEVKDGKTAVDKAGNLDSKLFRAPYGATDENIYSLLSKSNILADFSYPDHYNEYYNGQFIRMNIPVYEFPKSPASYLMELTKSKEPIIVFIDSSTSFEEITDLVQSLKSTNCRFVNASDLVGFELTVRKG
jgi:peptidoglycan/xylan/chitin deacetylase (PgdA/CDA1 family)